MFSFVVPIAVALLVTQVAVVATSVYLHRGLAHRALRLHPFLDWLFRCVLWITTGQNRREWVAVHRKHHAFTDREGDPHSPLMRGFWKIQLGNVYYYIREARNSETLARWAKDIKEDATSSSTQPSPCTSVAEIRIASAAWPLYAASRHRIAAQPSGGITE